MDAQEISFEDIRVGDTIHQVRRTKSGSEATTTFKVEQRGGEGTSSPFVEGQDFIIFENGTSGHWESWKTFLVDRPEPKDHLLVRINPDGSESIVTLKVVTLSEALGKRRDLLEVPEYRGRTYELRKVTKA